MKRKFRNSLAALLMLTPAAGAEAGVGKLSSAEVDEGKFSLQYNVRRTGDGSKPKNNAQDHILEAEYGVTDNWMLGLALDVVRRSPGQRDLNVAGFEVKRQFTDQSDGWWMNSAVKAEYSLAMQARGTDEGETGILLFRQDGKVANRANIKFTREFGDGRTGGVRLDTAWQTVYRHHPHFSPGIEWHANYGKIHDFNNTGDQEHYLGAIIVGKFHEADDSEFGYEIGYFRGLTDASADDAQRARLTYEIRF